MLNKWKHLNILGTIYIKRNNVDGRSSCTKNATEQRIYNC